MLSQSLCSVPDDQRVERSFAKKDVLICEIAFFMLKPHDVSKEADQRPPWIDQSFWSGGICF